MFHYPIYYEIHGRPDPIQFLQVPRPEMRSLTLYMQEALKLCAHIFHPPMPNFAQQITSFFKVLPSARGTKRQTDSGIASDSNQCGPEGPSPYPKDLKDIARPDPLPAGRRDHLGISGRLPLSDNNVVDGPDLPPDLPRDTS
jgi:hypothetical protein